MKLDIQWGYNNIHIHDGNQWKAAFKTNRGLFEPMVMFFGLTNAPATFQLMMNFIFCELINEGYVTIYMDDILIHTPNDLNLHQRVVNNILQILANNDLYLKPQKCQFEVTEVEYLSVVISEDCIAMDPVKVTSVKNWKWPTTLRELRTFLGFLNFYCMYIHNFSMLAAPLNVLMAHCAKGGRFHWNHEHELAFQALIDAVCTTPVLWQPRFEDPFVIDCNASAYAVGAILQQGGEKGKLHPVAFLSWTLDATQCNWNIYDKELFAVVHALETWRPYLVGSIHKTLINTDHNNLTYFKAAWKLNQQQARWMQELAEFDFKLRHVPRKKHVPADFLSQPFGENQGKDNNEGLVLLPPARFATVEFATELEDRRNVIQLYHNHPLAGHPGIANTIHLLS